MQNRRRALISGVALSATTFGAVDSAAQGGAAMAPTSPVDSSLLTHEEWLTEFGRAPLPRTRTIGGPLVLQRFKDPFYVVLSKDVRWRHSAGNKKLGDIAVPAGFVTDLASVPRVFWSLFRPDGDHVYAAVIHDYLYWEQDRTRSDADAVFRQVMDELEVTAWHSKVLHKAVDFFGQSAWDQNRAAKMAGECRIISDITALSASSTWAQWREANRKACR